MARYFKAENADRPIVVGSKPYPFTVVERVAGTAVGVLAVADAEGDAVRAAVLAVGGVEITGAEHAALLEKKKAGPPPVVREPARRHTREAAIKGRGAVVGIGASRAKEEPKLPVEADDAFTIGEVEA